MDDDERQDELQENAEIDAGDITSSEQVFLDGYHEQPQAVECAECSCLLEEAAKVLKKVFEDEELLFCSRSCIRDYQDSL